MRMRSALYDTECAAEGGKKRPVLCIIVRSPSQVMALEIKDNLVVISG